MNVKAAMPDSPDEKVYILARTATANFFFDTCNKFPDHLTL